MGRRRRAPGTQFARAGERTTILLGDMPLDRIRFRAVTLVGEPTGRIEMELAEGKRLVEELKGEQTLAAGDLKSLSVVPEHDTAITFLPVDRPSSPLYFLLGGALLLGAVLLTAWDFVVS